MTNDTSTLNGSLSEMKDQLIYELEQKGITANYDSSTGLLGLIDKIGDIEQGGPEIVSFDNLTTEFNYTRKRGNDGFSVTIPSGITSLGDYCFQSCAGLTSVTIPSGVTSLGNYCFYQCYSLTNATIPSSVTSLGDNCFIGCASLTNITIPSSVTSLGNNCFKSCSGLTNIAIPSSVTSLGDACFKSCTGLTNIAIPSSVTNLGTYCFEECTGLTSITIPSSVTRLENYCFNGCTGLTSITIPSSVTSLGHYCFNGCTGLTSITIPSSVTSLGNYCFRYCTNLVDYQLYWETPPVTWYPDLMPNNADTYFTIPNGTTANYVAKSFPSDKLIEAIFTDNGTTASHNDYWYINSYGTATVQSDGTKLLNTSGDINFVMRSIVPSNKTITQANIYSYTPPFVVEFDIVETDGTSNGDAQVQIYSEQTRNNFAQAVTTGHYKIEVKEDEQKIWVDDTLIKTTNLSLPNARITFRVRNGKYLIYKNFRVYNMPWGSHIELAATNPYMLTGETTDIVVKLRNGVCRPLNNKNITIGQSVFIDNGTTVSHNDSWSVTNGTMTRMDSYTRLVESAPTLMCQMNSGYITPTSTVEFDFKAVDGVKNWGLIYIRNGGGGNSLADLSLNNIGGEIGEWIHLKIVFNNTDTITIYSSKLDTPITKTLSSTDSNYRLLLYCGGANTELHFKNVIVYETINGVTYGDGEFVLHNVSVTDDTIFIATYSNVSATCTVYGGVVFYDNATSQSKNTHWKIRTSDQSDLTATVGTDGTTLTNASTSVSCFYFANPEDSSSESPPITISDFVVEADIFDSSFTDSDSQIAFLLQGQTTNLNLKSYTAPYHIKIEKKGINVNHYVDDTLIRTTTISDRTNYYMGFQLYKKSSITFRNYVIREI